MESPLVVSVSRILVELQEIFVGVDHVREVVLRIGTEEAIPPTLEPLDHSNRSCSRLRLPTSIINVAAAPPTNTPAMKITNPASARTV